MDTRIKILNDIESTLESTGVWDQLNLGEEETESVGHDPEVPSLAD